MRSKHENVTFLDPDVMENRSAASASPPLPGVPSAHSTVTAAAQVKRASHPEYPLERLCSHHSEPFQFTFARHAQQHFLEREDVEVVASRHELSIRAETEDAIEAALVVLRDLYGPKSGSVHQRFATTRVFRWRNPGWACASGVAPIISTP